MASRLLSVVSFVCVLVVTANGSTAGAVSGSVKDPKGAVIVGAEVRATSATTGETRTAVTDAQGRFRIDGLPSGMYKVEVSSPGFKLGQPLSIQVQEGRAAQVDITMEVAGVREELAVEGKSSVKPNSEPNYRLLRDARPLETYAVEGLVLKRDVATLTLARGQSRSSRQWPAGSRWVCSSAKGSYRLFPHWGQRLTISEGSRNKKW